MTSPPVRSRRAPIAVALDTPDLDEASRWARLVEPHVTAVKVGLELFTRYGPDAVASVRGGSGLDVFLDLKLHDIPNTVAGAAKAVARVRPAYLTVHATGGRAMIRAAADAAPEVAITAVTVLTSLDDSAVADMGFGTTVLDAVRRLAVLAVEAGARAVVCSPREVAAVRAEVGPEVILVTPGVRPSGSELGDQARVDTPERALANGANLLVVGRPVIRAADPGAAAASLAAQLRRAGAFPEP